MQITLAAAHREVLHGLFSRVVHPLVHPYAGNESTLGKSYKQDGSILNLSKVESSQIQTCSNYSVCLSTSSYSSTQRTPH